MRGGGGMGIWIFSPEGCAANRWRGPDAGGQMPYRDSRPVFAPHT
jgi:hypothetical protein